MTLEGIEQSSLVDRRVAALVTEHLLIGVQKSYRPGSLVKYGDLVRISDPRTNDVSSLTFVIVKRRDRLVGDRVATHHGCR